MSGKLTSKFDVKKIVLRPVVLQMPTFVFTEDYQVEFMHQYHEMFDVLRKDYLAGEMVWNFADFMTDQCK